MKQRACWACRGIGTKNGNPHTTWPCKVCKGPQGGLGGRTPPRATNGPPRAFGALQAARAFWRVEVDA